MTFWILTVLTTLGALAAFWATLRGRRDVAPEVRDARLAVYRDRLAELDGEQAAGTLDDGRYAEARRELEDAAAADLQADGVSVAGVSGSSLALSVVIGLAVPVIGYGLYAVLGAPHALTTVVEAPTEPHDMHALVGQLQERMEQTPDDLDGWMLLGRSRVRLGEYDAAVFAWRNAYRLAPDDPTVLANLGEALVLADPATLDGEGGVLIERALGFDPESPKALWYGGLLAAQRGEVELAKSRWQALLALGPPPALLPVIEQRLEALRRDE